MQGDELVTRRDYIKAWMDKQGLVGRVGKYIVLRQRNEIVDHDRTYEVQQPALPDKFEPGAVVFAAYNDAGDLVKARVVEDRGADGLFVEPKTWENRSQFLVERDQVFMLPIPKRPTAILRRELALYIGHEAAEAWHRARRARQPAAEHRSSVD